MRGSTKDKLLQNLCLRIVKTNKLEKSAILLKELGFNNGVTDRRDKVTFHTCRQSIFKKQIVLYVRVTGSINRS